MNQKRRKQAAIRAVYAERDAKVSEIMLAKIDPENLKDPARIKNLESLGPVIASEYLKLTQEVQEKIEAIKLTFV